MDWLNMINMSNTACRNCQHWVMDEFAAPWTLRTIKPNSASACSSCLTCRSGAVRRFWTASSKDV